jgi:DNA-binding response OmpR family regulator
MTFINASNTWDSAPSISPIKVIEGLIAEMKRAAFKDRDAAAFERASDSLSCFATAHLTPSVEDKWRDMGMTRQEGAIADALHARLGKVVSSETVLNAIYFDRAGDHPGDEIVRVFICKIRQKLKGTPYRIETIWGQGYSMVNTPGLVLSFPRVRKPKESIAA